MNVRKALVSIAVTATAALPGLATADTAWHATYDDAGASFHADHLTSTKTRAEVLAELDAARKDGSLYLNQREFVFPQGVAGPAKTRQQVLDGLRKQTAMERRARFELMVGG